MRRASSASKRTKVREHPSALAARRERRARVNTRSSLPVSTSPAPQSAPAATAARTAYRPTRSSRATLGAMPLYVRLRNDHYPHDEPSTRLDYYVVLSGGLEVGGFHRIGIGPSKGRWSWGAAIGTDDTTYTAGGYAAYPDVCCTLIALAFRRTLACADLRERPDAKPGPPLRASTEVIASTSRPAPPCEREKDRLLGPMVRNELRRTIRSGELVVGLPRARRMARNTGRGPSAARLMTRTSSGAARPASEDKAFHDFAACWTQWCTWAGLTSLAPLQRGANF